MDGTMAASLSSCGDKCTGTLSLEIVQQPPTFIRFRYETERTKNLLKTEVRLAHFHEIGGAVIKVSLFEETQDDLVPHTSCFLDSVDSKQAHISRSDGFTATFESLSIHIKKRKEKQNDISKHMAYLRFEAFREGDLSYPICKPVFSNKIYDDEYTPTNKLTIFRLCPDYGFYRAPNDIVLLTSRVDKNNIHVLFSYPGGSKTSVKPKTKEVHHQFGISIKMPHFDDPFPVGQDHIDVEISLFRPSNRMTSDPKKFRMFRSTPHWHPMGLTSSTDMSSHLSPPQLCSPQHQTSPSPHHLALPQHLSPTNHLAPDQHMASPHHLAPEQNLTPSHRLSLPRPLALEQHLVASSQHLTSTQHLASLQSMALPRQNPQPIEFQLQAQAPLTSCNTAFPPSPTQSWQWTSELQPQNLSSVLPCQWSSPSWGGIQHSISGVSSDSDSVMDNNQLLIRDLEQFMDLEDVMIQDHGADCVRTDGPMKSQNRRREGQSTKRRDDTGSSTRQMISEMEKLSNVLGAIRISEHYKTRTVMSLDTKNHVIRKLVTELTRSLDDMSGVIIPQLAEIMGCEESTPFSHSADLVRHLAARRDITLNDLRDRLEDLGCSRSVVIMDQLINLLKRQQQIQF